MIADIMIPAPQAPREITLKATEYVAAANAIRVTSDGERVAALTVAKRIKDLERAIVEHFEPSRKALDKAKKEVLAARDDLSAPLTEAIRIIDQKCFAFEREQRAAHERERKRLEDEARAKQEAQRLLDAAMSEAAGDTEAAEEAMTEALAPPVVDLPPAVAPVRGVSSASTWDVEITDKLAFLKHVVEQDPSLIYLVDVNASHMKSLCRQKDGALGFPGVRTFKTEHRRFRS